MIGDDYFERFSTPKYRAKNPVQRLLIRRFVDRLHSLFLEANPAKSVLEVGVGEGFLSGYLSEKFPEKSFTGVDLNDDDIARVRRLFPRIEAKTSSIYDLDFEPGRFDIVLCAEVLEHVEEPDRALASLLGLRPKQLIVTVPHEPWFMLSNVLRGKNLRRFGNDPEHLNHWTARSFERLVASQASVRTRCTAYPWILIRAEPPHGTNRE